MTARADILARIRAATGSAGAEAAGGEAAARRRADQEYAALPRPYLRAHHDPASHDIVALFAQRCADYRAVVERVAPGELPGAVARVLAARAAQTTAVGAPPAPPAGAAAAPPAGAVFVVPEGLPPE